MLTAKIGQAFHLGLNNNSLPPISDPMVDLAKPEALAPSDEEHQGAADPEAAKALLGIETATPNLNAPVPEGTVKPNTVDPTALRKQLDQTLSPNERATQERLGPLGEDKRPRTSGLSVGVMEGLNEYSTAAKGVIQSIGR